MPELPEVESIRRGINARGQGRVVDRVVISQDRVTLNRSLRMQPGGSDELVGRVAGKTIEAVVRRGKFLWLLTGEDQAILIHLGMSGQILTRSHSDDNPRNMRVRLELNDDTDLLFVDPRSFGYLAIVDLEPTGDGLPGGLGSDLPRLPVGVGHIARDLLDPYLDLETLTQSVKRKDSQIKRILLDQGVASGIGNIYADEALWRARVHYGRAASSLRAKTIASIYSHAKEVMAEALEVGGTSFDAQYVNVEGVSGYFARSLQVYGQEGQPCARCHSMIRRDEFMNRSSFYCARCQRR